MSYETCRRAFDESLPEEAMLTPWQKLQDDLYRWQRATYGIPKPEHLALGVVEEMGELSEAEDSDAERDAIADAAIFACQLATCFRLDFGVMVQDIVAGADLPEGWSIQRAGRLCHVVLKHAQGIRGMNDRETARRAVYEALMPILSQSSGLHTFHGDGSQALAMYFELVSSVAEKVMTRKKSALPQVAR